MYMYHSFNDFLESNSIWTKEQYVLSPDEWIILWEKYAIYKCKEVCEWVVEEVKNYIKNNN